MYGQQGIGVVKELYTYGEVVPNFRVCPVPAYLVISAKLTQKVTLAQKRYVQRYSYGPEVTDFHD